MNDIQLPENKVTSTLPEIKVTSTQTQIGDQVYDNHVIMAVLLDENDVDVTGLEEYPKVGTKIKTLCYTIDSTKSVFHDLVINANVRPLPPKLRKVASKLLQVIKWFSGLLAAKVTIEHALDSDNNSLEKQAITKHNEGKIENNPILKSIEDCDDNEMFKNMEIIGTITILGKIHLLLRLRFQGHTVLFFDISQTLKVT
jgi:hypothetical protein